MTRTHHPRASILHIHLRASSGVLAIAIALAPAVLVIPSAEARTDKILYSFTGAADGANPYAGLIRDAAGNLYGTTYSGGASGYGTVFEVAMTGTETVLYSFMGTPDGANPYAGLIRDALGNLYGTTNGGGAYGYGTVFEVDTTGTETVLYSFNGAADGASPYGGLVRDAAGNLYGTTYSGGASGYGTVFEVDKTGTETVLYSFAGQSDGANPYAGVIQDAAGNLYGTTTGGGNWGGGTVFKLNKKHHETTLYSLEFPSSALGELSRDRAGSLYGTTYGDGSGTCYESCGSVFKLDARGKETTLHWFTDSPDGAYPRAGVILDRKGSLYGTTSYGGANGWGIVFKLSGTTMTILHSFAWNGTDGILPFGGLVRDSAGKLYGTTSWGGTDGYGTVFKITP